MQVEGTISGYADRCHRRLVYRRQRDRIIRSRGGEDQSIIRANQPQPGRHRSYAPAPEFKLNTFAVAAAIITASPRSRKTNHSEFILDCLIQPALSLPNRPRRAPYSSATISPVKLASRSGAEDRRHDAVLTNGRDGGIGRRAGLRIQCRKACRFESCSRHQKIQGET